VTLVDIDAVSALVREAMAEAIMPRFRQIPPDGVEEKSPGEVVTVADQEAEAIISKGLKTLLPGVPVIGEEAVAADPSLLDALHAARSAWLVDPLDGTSNFVDGSPNWATEVALIHAGETVAAWLLRSDGVLFTAERHAGAYRDGTRVQIPGSPEEPVAPEQLRGAVLTRFLTDDERGWMATGLNRIGDVTSGFKCTAFEYPAILAGEQDFALFQRLLPWDHAPGVLLLTEAGGLVARPDGRPFRPHLPDQRGLLLARDERTWSTVRDLLYPHLAAAPVTAAG
jgi:fructose-1,6-bisphosphatase/inositol monophosphatase family enzyme